VSIMLGLQTTSAAFLGSGLRGMITRCPAHTRQCLTTRQCFTKLSAAEGYCRALQVAAAEQTWSCTLCV
jgi:hypothetical protein